MRILYVEPFDAGSHAAFTSTLVDGMDAAWTVLTMPGRHWKWRMRGAALHLAEAHREALDRPHDLLLASSFTPLADLVALVPSLGQLPKVVFFHENQWTYPVREGNERDHHFGFTQLVSALAADLCLFNSQHNRDGFLHGCREIVARMPDARPSASIANLAGRCEVMPLAVRFAPPLDPKRRDLAPGQERRSGPHILWNHRWEHDKGAEVFFAVLERLAARQLPFRLIVCGESFRTRPAVFAQARRSLSERIVHFGPIDDRRSYLELLESAQLAVSTSEHEFFGLSMLEATHAGAMPLVPDALAYPELFPARFRYATPDALEERLAQLCRSWVAGEIDLRQDRSAITSVFDADRILPVLRARLAGVVAARRLGPRR